MKDNITEKKHIDPKILKSLKDITIRMRAQTLDWMMSLSEEIDMKRETLHLAVLYLDAYLVRVVITKAELQLAAIACIILAFKLEQKAPISFVDIFISEGPRGYSRSRILDK